jgi:hypothetical protein
VSKRPCGHAARHVPHDLWILYANQSMCALSSPIEVLAAYMSPRFVPRPNRSRGRGEGGHLERLILAAPQLVAPRKKSRTEGCLVLDSEL